MRLAWALLVVPVACGRAAPPPAAAHGGVGGGAVARVGAETIPGSLLADVASAQHTDVHTALDRLIDDSLAAQAARTEGDERAPEISWAITSIVARAAADRVRTEAFASRLPTDEEVAALSRIHWLDVDVPEAVRVSHVVVLRPKDASQYGAARALASQIAAAASGATDESDFEARAKAVPSGALEVRVETLPPVVQDGRVVSPDHSYFDQDFTRASFTLHKPGEISGVVESSFGWHVIRLLERIPPKVVPIEQRRTMFAEEAISRRGRAALDAVIARRRGATTVEILPDAEASMAELARSRAP